MIREIRPELVEWFDARLAANGLAKHAISMADARTVFRCALEAAVGIRETGGNNVGPMVELIQDTVGIASHEAWCMSLIQSGLAYAEVKTHTKSRLTASEHCLTVWREAPPISRVDIFPGPGAICIWQKGESEAGHCGMVVAADRMQRTMNCVEGNTEWGVSGNVVERDGGGIYYTFRSMNGTGLMRVVGFLKPF